MRGAHCRRAWTLLLSFLVILALVNGECRPALTYVNGTLVTPYGDLDFLTLGKASLAITFPAQLNATFPLIVQPGRSTPGVFYKAVLCAPEDVAKCINAAVHGGGRLKFDAELIASNKGVWNNTLRRLHISNWRPRQWGYEATSTVFEDCWPNFSGASLMSFFSSFEADLDVYVDEEINNGQIVMIFRVLGVEIPVPVFFANFTMERMTEQRWYRRSSVFGFPVPDYILHEVVSADGGKGRWFDEFVKERNGAKFAYLEKID